jgi:hypothetical protein
VRSVDIRIVFDRDLTERQHEQVGRGYALLVTQQMIAGRLPREFTEHGLGVKSGEVVATAQEVVRAPRRNEKPV